MMPSPAPPSNMRPSPEGRVPAQPSSSLPPCVPHASAGWHRIAPRASCGVSSFPPFFLKKRRASLASVSSPQAELFLRYLFDDCALDMDRRELHRGAGQVAIEPQVFDLLVHLIRHRDRVVSKDDLLATIWKGRVVSESALFNRINAARKAIGDAGDRQRLIRTLPRKGLRFVGEVREEALRPVLPSDLPLLEIPPLAVLPSAAMSAEG